MNPIKKYLRKKALRKMMDAIIPKTITYNDDGTPFPYSPLEKNYSDKHYKTCYPIGCAVIIANDLVIYKTSTWGTVIGYNHYHDDPDSDKYCDNHINLIIKKTDGVIDQMYPDPSGIQPAEKELQFKE